MEITLSGGGFFIIRLTEFLLKQKYIKKVNILTSSRQATEKVLDLSEYSGIIKYEPEKLRLKQTLNNQQKIFVKLN